MGFVVTLANPTAQGLGLNWQALVIPFHWYAPSWEDHDHLNPFWEEVDCMDSRASNPSTGYPQWHCPPG